MGADVGDVLTEMLRREFHPASNEQLSRAVEQLRAVINNERRRAAVDTKGGVVRFLRSHGRYSAADLLKEFTNE